MRLWTSTMVFEVSLPVGHTSRWSVSRPLIGVLFISAYGIYVLDRRGHEDASISNMITLEYLIWHDQAKLLVIEAPVGEHL